MNEPNATPAPVDEIITRRLHPRHILKTMFFTAVIFICGAAAGWAVALATHRSPPGAEMAPEPPVGPMVDRLRIELLLTDDQVRQVTQVYQKREAALRAIREEMRPRFNSEYNQLRTEMQKILTAPQFDLWNRRFEDVRNRMLPPLGRGRGGPPGERGPGSNGGMDRDNGSRDNGPGGDLQRGDGPPGRGQMDFGPPDGGGRPDDSFGPRGNGPPGIAPRPESSTRPSPDNMDNGGPPPPQQ